VWGVVTFVEKSFGLKVAISHFAINVFLKQKFDQKTNINGVRLVTLAEKMFGRKWQSHTWLKMYLKK
jgi:hypothetical protein